MVENPMDVGDKDPVFLKVNIAKAFKEGDWDSVRNLAGDLAIIQKRQTQVVEAKSYQPNVQENILKVNKEYNLEALYDLRDSLADEGRRLGVEKVEKPDLLDEIIDDIAKGQYYSGNNFTENYSDIDNISQYSIELLKDIVHNYIKVPIEKKDYIYNKITERIYEEHPTNLEKKHLKEFLYGIINGEKDLESRFQEEFPEMFMEIPDGDMDEIEGNEKTDLVVEGENWDKLFEEIMSTVLSTQERMVLRLRLEKPYLSRNQIGELIEPIRNNSLRRARIERYINEGKPEPKGVIGQRVANIESKMQIRLKRLGFGEPGVDISEIAERLWGKAEYRKRMLAMREKEEMNKGFTGEKFEKILREVDSVDLKTLAENKDFLNKVLDALTPKQRALMSLLGESCLKMFDNAFRGSGGATIVEKIASENLQNLLKEGDANALEFLPFNLLEIETTLDKYLEICFDEEVREVFKAKYGLDDGVFKTESELRNLKKEKENYLKYGSEMRKFTQKLISDYSVKNMDDLLAAAEKKDAIRQEIFHSRRLTPSEKLVLGLKYNFNEPGSLKPLRGNDEVFVLLNVGNRRMVDNAVGQASEKLERLENETLGKQ